MASTLSSYLYSGITHSVKYIGENVVRPTVNYIGAAATYAYSSTVAIAKSASAQLADRVTRLLGDSAAYLVAGKLNKMIQKKANNFLFPEENATCFIDNEIQNAKKLNRAEKTIAKRVAKSLIQDLKWVENPASFQSLVAHVGSTLATYTKSLNTESVRQSTDLLVQAGEREDSSAVDQARAHYRDNLARSLGYQGYTDLADKTFKVIQSNAGYLISANAEQGKLRAIINLFKSIYRNVVGKITLRVIKKRLACLSQGIRKLDAALESLPPVFTQNKRRAFGLLINTQADIFALYALHELLQVQGAIRRGELPPEGTNASLQTSLKSLAEDTAHLVFSENLLQREGIRLAKQSIEEIDFEAAIGTINAKLSAWLL